MYTNRSRNTDTSPKIVTISYTNKSNYIDTRTCKEKTYTRRQAHKKEKNIEETRTCKETIAYKVKRQAHTKWP